MKTFLLYLLDDPVASQRVLVVSIIVAAGFAAAIFTHDIAGRSQ